MTISRRTLWTASLLAAGIAAVAIWQLRIRPHPTPNIILITIESLRADVAPHPEDQPGPSPCPALDALARESMVYEDAHAVTSWTLTSHASLFTGLYPATHRTTAPLSRLDDSYITMAEALAEHGYQCAGFVSGPYLRREYNLDQGFEIYDDSPATSLYVISKTSPKEQPQAHSDVTSPEMERLIREFLREKRDASRPLFLFAYFWDPHYDYIPPPPYDSLFVDAGCEPIDVRDYEVSDVVKPGIRPGQLAYLRSQYLGEIRWTDDHLARIFDLLKAEGLWENSAVIVTADHGEEFFEHGEKGHKHNLHVETVQVPLIVKYPRESRVGRDPRLVSHVDLLPTVLDLIGQPGDPILQGRSLLGAPRTPQDPIFFALSSVWYTVPLDAPEERTKNVEEWYGIRRGDYKLVVVPGHERAELYNVRSDPGETSDRIEEDREIGRSLLKTLVEREKDMEALAARFGRAGEATLDPQEMERLRSLGYIR